MKRPPARGDGLIDLRIRCRKQLENRLVIRGIEHVYRLTAITFHPGAVDELLLHFLGERKLGHFHNTTRHQKAP